MATEKFAGLMAPERKGGSVVALAGYTGQTGNNPCAISIRNFIL